MPHSNFKTIVCLWALTYATISKALDNGLGLTPQLGWNTWNHFGCEINETIILRNARAMKEKGLLDLGYEYIGVRSFLLALGCLHLGKYAD